MTGPERPTASNSYTPRWARLDEIESMNLLPIELREFLTDVATNGWPEEMSVVERDP